MGSKVEDFKYHSIAELKTYVGQIVQWLDLSGNVREAVLDLHKNRPILPESGGVYADTVKTKLK